jgi:hypothetical protein
MTALIDSIATWLITGGFATVVGTDIFMQRYPPGPLTCVVVSSLPAGDSAYYTDEADAEVTVDRPGCKVDVRSLDPQAAYDSIVAITEYLDHNPPTGYLQCHVGPTPNQNTTAPEDLTATGGPIYQFSSSFVFTNSR